MVPILNAMSIHTACYGNHDFDFGLDQLGKLPQGSSHSASHTVCPHSRLHVSLCALLRADRRVCTLYMHMRVHAHV